MTIRMRNRDVFLLETAYDPMMVRGLLRGCCGSNHPSGSVHFEGKIPYDDSPWIMYPEFCGRNFCLPILHCALRSTEQGSILQITAQCNGLTRIFMAVWNGLLLLVALRGVVSASYEGFFAILAAGLMMLWGLGLSYWGFWRPLDRAKKDLCGLLNGTIIEN